MLAQVIFAHISELPLCELQRHRQACGRHCDEQSSVGQAINGLWRQMMISILGGAAFGDNGGVGNCTMEYMLCQDGEACVCR